MHVLYQFNDKYAPYAGVSITSLFENNKSEDITVWILGENIQKCNIDRLIQTAEKHKKTVLFVDDNKVNCLIEKMKELEMPAYRGSYAANMRLFLSEILPENIDRVLYLDADTIVNGNIANMYNMNLDGNAIAMVQDSLGEMHKKDLGFSKEEMYFNSGVILFDIKKWKEQELTDRIIDHVRDVRAQYPSPDQDLINVVCHNSIKCMDPEFNFQPIHIAYSDEQYLRFYGKTKYYSMEDIANARDESIIIHCFRFIGEFPWDKDNVHPFTELFDRYLRKSMWNDYQKMPANNRMVMKIEKRLYKILPRGLFLFVFALSHSFFYYKANRMSENKRISKSM